MMAKNVIKMALLVLIVLVWLPTGLPDDLFFIPLIVGLIGIEAYIVLSVGLTIYLYKTIKGKTLKEKFGNAKREAIAFIS